ncbi:hypothetical protein [Actinomadura chibensis]|uniref:Uncharacterized protein n=1 Tax=Actinomadura chibensis TaxID=392828 RepID=A0A5D0NHP8_9ACTN|nr:hypothetical protein [Actinomadura chibensis]TYB43956.1 hypothetical protein FXF69_23610 [Actinomadura chibensis]
MRDAVSSGHEVRGRVTSLFALPLVFPRSTQYARLGVAPEATAGEIRAATNRLAARLKAGGADEETISEMTGLDLEKGEAREAYDAQHPPLPLMRLEPAWAPVFDDRAACLAALRRELEAFLLDAGETVYFPDDTTRTDFTADFTPTPLLDSPEFD